MRCPECGREVQPGEWTCLCQQRPEDLKEEKRGLDTERMQKFVELEQKKKQLEWDLQRIKDEMTAVETDIIDDLIDNDVDKVSVRGRLLYPKRQVVANVHNKQAAIEAIKKAGLTEYVGESYNANQISAYLRECDAEGRELPEEFRGIIEPYEKVKLGIRNA